MAYRAHTEPVHAVIEHSTLHSYAPDGKPGMAAAVSSTVAHLPLGPDVAMSEVPSTLKGSDPSIAQNSEATEAKADGSKPSSIHIQSRTFSEVDRDNAAESSSVRQAGYHSVGVSERASLESDKAATMSKADAGVELRDSADIQQGPLSLNESMIYSEGFPANSMRSIPPPASPNQNINDSATAQFRSTESVNPFDRLPGTAATANPCNHQRDEQPGQ